MSSVVWLGGALLLFGTCLTAQPQNPSGIPPAGHPSNVLSLSVNTKRCVHTIGDHFLGITFEPSTVLSASQKNLGSTAINMARGLRPAYVRISGPECNYFRFRGGQDTAKSSPAYPAKQGRNNITITGWHWSQLNEFIAKTGLDLIVGLNVMNRQHGTWDLGNALDLISYSDKRGYDMAFQLGNDIRSIESRVDGSSLGRDATRLRKVLEAFPRYANSAIIGPDVKSCETQEEARYLKNFITESGSSINAVTYQVPFSGEKNVENPTAMFNYIQNQMDTRVWQKDLLNKYLGRIGNKKPLWIVESRNRDRRGDFVDGLNWAQRLCAGARVGINTIFRKPSLLSLSEPTPDYWVSVLHKALVGSEVLDIKFSPGNKTRLETVAHCTKMSPFNPNEGILAPEYRYNRGAVTVFGVNMGTENVKILLKTGEKQSLPLHQYFLTGNNRQYVKRAARSSSTMLNEQKLILSPNGELPILSPKIQGSHQLITIPGQCVFFIVLPDSESKACTTVQIEEPKELYKNGEKVVAQDGFDEVDYDTTVFDREDELVSNEKNNYVAFRHEYTKASDESVVQKNERQEEPKAGNNEMAGRNNEQESRANDNSQQPEPIVKYVTFSNNNWLSRFPKLLNNQRYSVKPLSYFPTETTTTTEMQTERAETPAQSRREKYHILAQAVVSQRYPEKNIRSDTTYPNLDSTMESISTPQALKLIKRSVDHDLNSKEINEMLEKFTNKENPSSNTILNAADGTSLSTVLVNPNENHTSVLEHPKKTIIDSAIPEVHQSTIPTKTSPQETTTTSAKSTETSVAAASVTGQQHEKVESHIQKIKTRAEQALARVAKLNEKTSRKQKAMRSQDRPKEEDDSIARQEWTTATASAAEANAAKTEPAFVEKFRYNRQTNSTTTESDLQPVRPSVAILKSRKSTIFPATEPTSVESDAADGTTCVAGRDTKLRDLAKTMKSNRVRAGTPGQTDEGKSMTREVRETTRQPAGARLGNRPVLGKVKTSQDVNAVQIVTNGKVVEKLMENLRDGKKTLQSERGAAADDQNDRGVVGKRRESKTAGATTATSASRMKALEARIKARRTEAERRLHSRTHRVSKRSPTSNRLIVEEHVNGILQDDDDDDSGFAAGSDVAEIVAQPMHETIEYRHPRAVADFTVKLNEVNTYVDKTKKSADQRNNEILGAEDWTNDIRPPTAEYDSETDGDASNAKSKRKSVFGSRSSEEDDFGGKATAEMMNKLFNQMHKIWKYIKKTFLF